MPSPTSLFYTPIDPEEAKSATGESRTGGFPIPPGSIGAILSSQALHGEYLPGMKYRAGDFLKNTAIMDEVYLQMKERALHCSIPDGSIGAILRSQALHGGYLPGLGYGDKDHRQNTVMMDDVYRMIKERAIHGKPPTAHVGLTTSGHTQEATNLLALGVAKLFAPGATNLFAQGNTDISARVATSLFAKGNTDLSTCGSTNLFARGATDLFAQGTTDIFAQARSNLFVRASTNLLSQEPTSIFATASPQSASCEWQMPPLEPSQLVKLRIWDSEF